MISSSNVCNSKKHELKFSACISDGALSAGAAGQTCRAREESLRAGGGAQTAERRDKAAQGGGKSTRSDILLLYIQDLVTLRESVIESLLHLKLFFCTTG